MKYKGSCHCGNIQFEVEGDLDSAFACNCSICSRKGTLLWFVPHTQFHLLTPEQNISTYTFNKKVIQHRFCPTCGIHPFEEGSDKDGKQTAAINIRCLDDIDLNSITVKHFNGHAL
ncbi:GFA family protein [Methylophaga sp. OBS4]|uniref:GFA family protein n=1 Tax=Methylophaga sp. OBS4 TaxID=2991935 RepID=UPI00224F4658|nr:GFA family protein [Methylophaga sp. OBS4]MCX4188035.1 GFA family protein [Methylophaga sp. OBS4]